MTLKLVYNLASLMVFVRHAYNSWGANQLRTGGAPPCIGMYNLRFQTYSHRGVDRIQKCRKAFNEMGILLNKQYSLSLSHVYTYIYFMDFSLPCSRKKQTANMLKLSSFTHIYPYLSLFIHIPTFTHIYPMKGTGAGFPRPWYFVSKTSCFHPLHLVIWEHHPGYDFQH